MFDRLGVLGTLNQRLPGEQVIPDVEVAIGDVAVLFQSHRIEEIIPVCHFPGVELTRITLMMLPKIAGARVNLAAPGVTPMGVTGDGDAALPMYLLDDALHGLVRVDVPFYIHCQDMISLGLIGNLGAGNEDHAISIPGPDGFLPEMLQVAFKIVGGNGPGSGMVMTKLLIDDMISDADGIKTAGAIKVDYGFQWLRPIAPLSVDMKIT